jgi:hypothetical protein
MRAAANLAVLTGRDETAERWKAFADAVLHEGILQEAARNQPEAPGLVDPETGCFLNGRKVSMLRDLWTRHPDFLLDRSETLDISMLGLAVPFGLLPASDERLVKTALAILRANQKFTSDQDVLARATFDPHSTSRGSLSNVQQEVSSLATLWMVRYLIQLGRETGQSRHWNRAITMLDAILSRMSPLGLVLRPTGRGPESARVVPNPGGNAWRLHAMLIDVILDLGGFEHDVIDRKVTLEPVLPTNWTQTGISRTLPCGKITYRLERPLGGRFYRLNVEAKLNTPTTLQLNMTCPGLVELGPWRANPATPEPTLDPTTGKLNWSVSLPSGDSLWTWAWG